MDLLFGNLFDLGGTDLFELGGGGNLFTLSEDTMNCGVRQRIRQHIHAHIRDSIRGDNE
jgi:hypothetical protein